MAISMDSRLIKNLQQCFVELENLEVYSTEGQLRWMERARWIKLEEDVDEYTNQWSAPFIPSLSLKALTELKTCIENGCVCFGMRENTVLSISDAMVSLLVTEDLISASHADELSNILLSRHKHIRRKIEAPRLGQKWLTRKPSYSVSRRNSMLEPQSTHDIDETVSIHSIQMDKMIDISNKLPVNTEVTTILTAQLDFIKQPFAIFIRLDNATFLGNMTEVKHPVRFICFIGGPVIDVTTDYLQLGKCLGTLMSDSRFLTLAYCSEIGEDLLSGIDRFLEECIVIPSGDWSKQNFKHSIPRWEIQMNKQNPMKFEPQPKRAATGGAITALPIVTTQSRNEDPLARTGRLFGCLRNDVKRKLPHYFTDFRDIFDVRCFVAVVFMYLAVLAPTITFGGLMSEQTDGKLGISEMILATSSAGILFSFLSGQPLIIVGPTGPMLIMETNIYVLAKALNVEFLAWRAWIGIWVFVICLIIIALDLCVFVRAVTRFTEEIFAVLVSIIFIQKAISFMVKTFKDNPISNHHPTRQVCIEGCSAMLNYSLANSSKVTTGSLQLEHPCYSLMTAILILMTFFLAFYFRKVRTSRYFSLKIRHIISDFCVILAVAIVITFDTVLSDDFTKKLTIKKDYFSRNWVVKLMGDKQDLYVGHVFLAILPAFLVSIILFMETGLTAVILDKKENKFKKGFGYHLDLLIVASLACISSIAGLPWMCASPVNSLSHFHTLTILSSTHAPGTNPFIVEVKEQRVTNMLIHLLIGGSVLFIPMLQRIPVAILFGVFLFLGFTSLSRVEFIHRLQLLFIPYKMHPDTRFVRKVQTKKIHLFTLIQLFCLVILAIVKETKLAAIFPFLIMCLVPLRRLLRVVFTEEELEDLDNEENEDEFAIANDFEISDQTVCVPLR
eukprot:gene10924-12085_t